MLQAGKLLVGDNGAVFLQFLRAISDRKMGIVLFPQCNLFLACILVSRKIVLKLPINFNEKNISTSSCAVTNQQLIGSHGTMQTL